MKTEEIKQIVDYLVDNWDKIKDTHKVFLKPSKYATNIKDATIEDHIVILILNRQRPSVVPSYDFDEERIGITRTGKIIWGFDSGCSCPSPWEDNYPGCYNISKTWKEFEINIEKFDVDLFEDINNKYQEIKNELEIQ